MSKQHLDITRDVDPDPCHPEEAAATVRGVQRVTWAGLVVNVLLAAVKGVVGIMAHSQALVADAAHSVSDLASDAAVLVGVHFWTAPADADHPHGHRKVETVVTVIIGLMVGVVGLGIGWDAIKTLYALATGPESEASSPGLMAAAAALASVVVKEWLYRWTVAEGRRLKSSAVIANAWHHRSDALSSIPVLVVVLAMEVGRRYGASLGFLDPIAAVLVAAMILRAALSIIRGAMASLLDAGACRQTTGRLREIALSTPDVMAVHALRTRYLGPGGLVVDLHVLVDGALSVRRGHAVTDEVERRMMEALPLVVEVMIHLEPNDAFERNRE